MAFVDLGTIGATGSSANNQATLALTTTATVPAGSLIVVVVGDDNRVTGGGDDAAVSGVAIGTNAFAKARQNASNLAAQAGASCSVWWWVASTEVASGSTITATFTNNLLSDATAISARAFSFASHLNTVAVENTNALANDAADPGALDAATANHAALRIRAIAGEASAALGGLTVTASWVDWEDGNSAATGTTAEIAVRAEHIISTGTGASSNPTWGTCDNASVYVAFQEVPKPFIPIEYAKPAAAGQTVDTRTWVQASRALLQPAEVQYMPSVVVGSDNPATALQPTDARTWIGRAILEVTAPAAAPFVQADWPNPAAPSNADRTWISQAIRAEIVVSAPFAQLDWPTAARLPDSVQTWLQSPQVPAPAAVEYLPCTVTDWGNPSLSVRPGDLTWINQAIREEVVAPVPFAQTDWPGSGRVASDQRTWLQSPQVPAAEVVKPFGQTDWPSVPARMSPVGTWLQSPQLVVYVPREPLIAPIQRGRPKVADDWLQSRALLLPPPTPLPPTNYDWPRAREPAPFELRTWLQSPQVPAPAVIEYAPGFVTHWGRPSSRVLSADNTWINQAIREAVEVVKPFAQADWPNAALASPAELRTWLQSWAHILPEPVVPPVEPPVVGGGYISRERWRRLRAECRKRCREIERELEAAKRDAAGLKPAPRKAVRAAAKATEVACQEIVDTVCAADLLAEVEALVASLQATLLADMATKVIVRRAREVEREAKRLAREAAEIEDEEDAITALLLG